MSPPGPGKTRGKKFAQMVPGCPGHAPEPAAQGGLSSLLGWDLLAAEPRLQGSGLDTGYPVPPPTSTPPSGQHAHDSAKPGRAVPITGAPRQAGKSRLLSRRPELTWKPPPQQEKALLS